MRQKPGLKSRRKGIKLTAVVNFELPRRRVGKIYVIHKIGDYCRTCFHSAYIKDIGIAIHAANVDGERITAGLCVIIMFPLSCAQYFIFGRTPAECRSRKHAQCGGDCKQNSFHIFTPWQNFPFTYTTAQCTILSTGTANFCSNYFCIIRWIKSYSPPLVCCKKE